MTANYSNSSHKILDRMYKSDNNNDNQISNEQRIDPAKSWCFSVCSFQKSILIISSYILLWIAYSLKMSDGLSIFRLLPSLRQSRSFPRQCFNLDWKPTKTLMITWQLRLHMKNYMNSINSLKQFRASWMDCIECLAICIEFCSCGRVFCGTEEQEEHIGYPHVHVH